MKNALILLFAILMSFDVMAQLAPAVNTAGNGGLIASSARYGSKSSKGYISYEEAVAEYESIDGSPYLNGGEIKVDFIMNTGNLVENVTILYDLYHEEVIASKGKESNIILNTDHYKMFTHEVNGEKATYRWGRNPDEPTRLFKVLYEDSDLIFCSAIKVSILKNERHIPGQESNNKKFIQKTEHFVILDNKATEISLRKGNIFEHLPSAVGRNMRRQMRGLKLKKLKKEKDYIRVMENLHNPNTQKPKSRKS